MVGYRRDLATITAHWGERPPSVPMVTLDGEYAYPRGWIRCGSRANTGAEARACWRVSENCASFPPKSSAGYVSGGDARGK